MSNNQKLNRKTKVLNLKTGKFTTKTVSFDNLIIRRELTSQLTSEQITRIKKFYSFLGFLLKYSFEDWVMNFTRDVFPEREIKCWERITIVFVEYTKQNTLSFKQKRDILYRLLNLSFGEKPKDKLSKNLFLFWEQLIKEIIEINKQNPPLSTKLTDKIKADVITGENIDYIELVAAYHKYINKHNLAHEETDNILVKLMHLMAGEEPKDELSRELLHILEDKFNPQNITDDRKRVVSRVVQRKGQSRFLRELLKAYQRKCAITGFGPDKVLQAAHIIPYLGSETNHPSNGILLRVDIHILFDQHLLSIHPKSYEVVISPTLCGTDYEGLGGKKLLLPDKDRFKPNSIALQQHYQTFLQKCDK
ncbi:HNH endonuclease signature motif containing protein [Nostoc sp. FACHB-888]|uniref:HNH endonuclease n=1 Tax=Nostoc sp. FACHB-888 TaxID=2692842 RepID=UPI0016820BE8|nr:HNH endonuclease signature motif containing protein [Nostoc sp. FACHB-888]MBD2246490.1 HNH endonuclease [Nostoc sp. FACHB-888]